MVDDMAPGDAHRRMRHAVCTGTAAVLIVCATSAQAQDTATPSPAGAIVGIVTTIEDAPLPRARVGIVGNPAYVLSGDNGAFRVERLALGRHSLEVRMIGYAQTLIPIEVRSGQVSRVHVMLVAEPVAEPVALDTVRVTARPRDRLTPQMRGFEERRARGAGKFFTREEIARMQARLFTDILRRAPGFAVLPIAGQQGGFAAHGTRVGAVRACPVLFYMNGSPLPLPPDVAINNFIAPEDVAGIEVYTASEIPPQFNNALYGARCGVVVIWMRSGH